MRTISQQLVLAACGLAWSGTAQTPKDKVGIAVMSLPYAALSLDNTSAGPRRSFLIGQDYAVNPGLQAVAGDFDGNGKDSLAMWVAKEKRFLVGNTNTPSAPLTPATFTAPAVGATARAISGDWDNDGDDDFGLYDPGTQTWHLELPTGITSFQWTTGPMQPGLIPVISDWNGTGQDTIGLFDHNLGSPTNPTFYLADANTATAGVRQVTLQSSTAGYPCAGNWIPGGTADTVGFLDLDTRTFHLGAAVNTSLQMQTIGVFSTVQFDQPGERFLPGQVSPPESSTSLPTGLWPMVGDWDTAGSGTAYAGFDWPRGTPASQGFNDTKLGNALGNGEDHLHSVLVIRNGVMVADRYYNGWNELLPNNVKSTSKSILSCLYGIAIDKGHLPSGSLQSIDLAPLFPSQYAAKITATPLKLYHMLTMSAGLRKTIAGGFWSDRNHLPPMVASNDWVDHVLDFMGDAALPGQVVTYSTGLTHVAAYLLAHRTGLDPRQFAKMHLWAHLGIAPTRWDNEPVGNVNSYAAGGWEMWMLPRDMARFGQLYLDQGVAGDRQVVSAAWVAQSLTATETITWAPIYMQLPNYGLWWYRAFFKRIQTADRYETFWTWGYGGQHIFIVPSLNLLVVTTSEWSVPWGTQGTQAGQNQRRFRKVLEALFD